eukprot:s1575_g1.t1
MDQFRDRRRHGDPFPLNLEEVKVRAETSQVFEAQRAIWIGDSLNRLALHDLNSHSSPVLSSARQPTVVQDYVIDRIVDSLKLHGDMPDGLSAESALSDMQAAEISYDGTPNNLANYDPEKLKVLRSRVQPKRITNFLPAEPSKLVEHYESQILAPEASDSEPFSPYWDPQLRRELKVASAIAWMTWRDLGSPFSRIVEVGDASSAGYAMMSSEPGVERIRKAVSFHEKWRFIPMPQCLKEATEHRDAKKFEETLNDILGLTPSCDPGTIEPVRAAGLSTAYAEKVIDALSEGSWLSTSAIRSQIRAAPSKRVDVDVPALVEPLDDFFANPENFRLLWSRRWRDPSEHINIKECVLPRRSCGSRPSVQKTLSRSGTLKRSQAVSTSCCRKSEACQKPSTSLPSVANQKKPGATSKRTKQSVAAKSTRYEDILKRCPPERKLRLKRVRADTVLHYAESVDRFLDWCRRYGRRSTDASRVDRSMSIYFDHLFEDGCAMSAASYTLFGYLALKAIPDRPERDMFPLSRSALGAWRGSRAGSSRVGMVPQVIYHFACFCVRQSEYDAALAVLLQYDLYARPSEILQLCGRDLVPSVHAFQSPWGVLFGNSDCGETTKSGAQDDVVLADSPHRQWANKLLKHLGKFFAGQDVKIFQTTLPQYEQLLRNFSKQSGLRQGLFTPHVVRHSGPCFDLINEYRDFDAIQARGRWISPHSAARYRKPGRLLMTAASLPPKFRTFTEEPLHSALHRTSSATGALLGALGAGSAWRHALRILRGVKAPDVLCYNATMRVPGSERTQAWG